MVPTVVYIFHTILFVPPMTGSHAGFTLPDRYLTKALLFILSSVLLYLNWPSGRGVTASEEVANCQTFSHAARNVDR